MTKQEEYQLTFKRLKDSDGDFYFSCEHFGNTNQYQFYAHIIDMMDANECEGVIENIIAAQNSEYYEEFVGPDSLSDDDTIELSPPNVIVGGWSVSMTDWKQLMQEWIDFLNSYS